MEFGSRIRTISAGTASSGSYTRVHLVTEAQSILPSYTSAFSLEGVNISSPLVGRRIAQTGYPESDRNVSSYQDPPIFDDPNYTDTVQSNDSTFSLLRRSISVPAEYRFESKHSKSSRPHCREIFQDFLPKNDGMETDSVGSYQTNTSYQWRGTMVDLVEKPDYIDSLQSTSSGTALLAHTARIIASKGPKRSASLGNVAEVIDIRQEAKKLKKNLFILSLSFSLMFTSYLSVRNLQSSLNSEGGLGTYTLSSVYVMLFVGCIFATTVVQRLRPKPTMLLSMIANILYVAANSYPSFFTLLPAAGIVGFSLSVLWTAHATYLTSIAIRYAEVTGKQLMNVLSKFNGFFFMFFQMGQILSGFISSVILISQESNDDMISSTIEYVVKNTTASNVSHNLGATANYSSQNSSFGYNQNSTLSYETEAKEMNMTISTLEPIIIDIFEPKCGPMYCSGTNVKSEVEVGRHILFILLGILLGIAFAALLVMGFFLDRLEGVIKKSSSSMKDQMLAMFKFFIDGKVMCLLPMMFYSLTEVAFMFGEFNKAYVSCSHGMYLIGFVMMCLSACGALSSYINGKMQKYCGRMPLLLTAGGINFCLLVGLLTWEPTPDNKAILFVVAGLWGAADGIWITQIISLFGVLFHKHKEPAFAGLKMCQALAVATSFALSPYMCTQLKIIMLIALLVLAVIGYLALEYQLKKQRESHIVLSPGRETPV